MKVCPNCGERVYKLGCVNCDEVNYIAEQEMLTELQYGSDETDVPRGRAAREVRGAEAMRTPPPDEHDQARGRCARDSAMHAKTALTTGD